MIGLDEAQIQTLADGWEFEFSDVDAAVQIADVMMMPLPMFVGTVDEIVAQVRQAVEDGHTVDDRYSASHIMWAYGRVALGLPL